jgi:hypothetical protein
MLFLLVDVVHGWTPDTKTQLVVAVNACIDETPDGSCPTYAATKGAVMSDWDTSKITNMLGRT